jgi:hypothetical protein
MDSFHARLQGSGPQPSYRTPPARRGWDWDRNDPHGFIRIALVFLGAAVGMFIVYTIVRLSVVPDRLPAHFYYQPVERAVGAVPGGRRHER